MAADFVSEVEGILGEHEADLEMNQPKSPRPGEFKPQFPAKALLYAINRGVQVSVNSVQSQQTHACITTIIITDYFLRHNRHHNRPML